ncbi:MAG: S24 family peptidase [bacterium]|nr:S24 family peptidase [bacterium]
MHETQEKLLKFIQEKDLSGFTLRGIGDLIGEKSAQKIKHHLSQLAKKGFISYDSHSRSIRISPSVSKEGDLVSLPIVGSANCGPATIFADPNVVGYLRVSKKFIPIGSRLFVLQANGVSMNKAKVGRFKKNIEDGDFVVVDGSSANPNSGEYVVSVIDGMANIKKFLVDKLNKRIVLESESTQQFFPIFIHEDDDYQISGMVIDVIKKARD